MIRIDCYLAVLDKFKKEYPDAHFEVITRTAKSPLAPSWELLKRAKAQDMPFPQYCNELQTELANSTRATQRLNELVDIAQEKDLFLVCFEKDETKCHRSMIKEMLEKMIKIEYKDIRKFM